VNEAFTSGCYIQVGTGGGVESTCRHLPDTFSPKPRALDGQARAKINVASGLLRNKSNQEGS
jgi:hypothetical protein